jgi:hypothetical protein
MFSNEEDLKNKVVVPYLHALGFQPSEISFEKSFSIRLGRNKHEITKVKDTLSGRLDILCRKGERNLFLIEVKADEKALEDEDINQGISYARLLDNIPPFVLITNGKKTRVIDSITRKVLNGLAIGDQSDFWKNGCVLSTEEDLSIRYQALRHFVSMSPTNVQLFCSRQIRDRMGSLAGTGQDREAKFNSDTHVRRVTLEAEFQTFLTSNFHVFSIIGDSGVGKTSSLCYLCTQSYKSEFSLFYNAALLNRPLLETIAGDLNLFFSATTIQDKVLTVLNEISLACGRQVIIFLDAIDENPISHFRYELSELALKIRSTDRVKLCVSCKTNLWPLFLTINGNETYLQPSVYVPAISAASSNNLPGFILTRFEDAELDEVIGKYRRHYGLKGEISPEIREELRHGFFLQVFSHVYSDKQLPTHVNRKELLESYLQLKLDRVAPDKRVQVFKILVATAKLMLENGSNNRQEAEAVSAEQIIRTCDLPLFDDLPSELFANYFLIRSNELYNQSVTFYYSRIRDYLLVEYAYGLHKLSPENLEKELPKFFNGIVGFSAMHFFSENCPPQQRAVLQKHTKFKVSEYLFAYSEYLNRHFYNTKSSFDPHTNGDIGIIVPKDTATLHGGYALFPIEFTDNGAPIVELPTVSVFGDESAFLKYKARVVHGSFLDLLRDNTDDSVMRSVDEQLKSVIDKMQLNEACSPTLDIEKVLHICYQYGRQLGYPKIEDYFLPRLDSILPLDLHILKNNIHRFFAVEHFKDEYIREQISLGNIHPVNNVISYSEGTLDWDVIQRNAEKAIAEGTPIGPPSIGGDYPPFVYLDACINRLLAGGITRIDQPQLPQPDVLVKDIPKALARRNGCQNWIPDIQIAQFTDDQIQKYISVFFQVVAQAYKELVESCFPLMKADFAFYRTLPHVYYVKVVLDIPNAWQFTYGYHKSPNGAMETIFVHDEFWKDGVMNYGLNSFSSSSLDDIFDNRSSARPIVRGINTSKVNERLIIRSSVYKHLKHDLNELRNKRREP